MAKTLTDVHPNIIQTHILPRLDGPSLFSTAASSSHLQILVCSDENLWSHICKSTWPSITHPRLHQIISTFPAGHRSFFRDSFPALITDVDHLHDLNRSSHHPLWPSQIISAVDLRYQNDIVYSKVEFTDTTDEFLSSVLRIKLNDDVESKSIDLNVDDEVTLSHLKESLSLNWILIDPTRKHAGNLSSVKPVGARKGWMNDDTHLLYAIVLPGCDENKIVQCTIHVVLGVGVGRVGLQVKEVLLELLDLDLCRLKGRDFLVITQRALSEENYVRRKLVDDEERRRRYREFKRISINSLSHLQTEVQSNNKEVQRPFNSMKAQTQCIISRLKAFEFVFCVMFVVALSWLLNLFSSN